MYTKAKVITNDNKIFEDVDIELELDKNKGSIYTLDHEMTYKVKEVKAGNVTYYVNVTKCTFGRGCRFVIKDYEFI